MINLYRQWCRLFEIHGGRTFINSIWVTAYRDLSAIAVQVNNNYTGYMPHKSVEKTNHDGLQLYADTKRMHNLFAHIDEIADEIKEAIEKELDKQQVDHIVSLLVRSLEHYRWTEFFYTDKAYASKDKEIQHNMLHFGKLKYKARETLNRIYFGKDAYIQIFLKKLAPNIPMTDLFQYRPDELAMLLDKQQLDETILRQRDQMIVLWYQNELQTIQGDDAHPIVAHFDTKTDAKELKGAVANRGRAKGVAKILLPDFDNFHRLEQIMQKMNQGDILIAETTSPELTPAIKKAAAIVTNQGGMMSHAAVVARELNIPCIVATEHATSVFNDGDIVQVDAINGIVKKVE